MLGFLRKILGKENNTELLVPCQNSDCKKLFKDYEGRKYRRDLNVAGLIDFKCPFCGTEMSTTLDKLKSIQVVLRKKMKS